MGDLIRRILEDHRGRFVSGQEIAGRLGMTRAAVWKQVRTLRRKGFAIEGARGAGYRLVDGPDPIDERELFGRLSPGTSWTSLVFFDVTDSTNSRAMEMAGEQEDRRALGEILRNVARLSIWQQRPDRAVAYADRALSLAEQIGNQESKGLAWVLVGEVRAAAGTPPGAEPPDACFRRGIDTFRRIGHQVELARALYSYGHTLRALGRLPEARPLLQEALHLFTAQGSALADRARQLLG